MWEFGEMKKEKDIFLVSRTFKAFFLSEKISGVRMLFLRFCLIIILNKFKVYIKRLLQ